MRARLALLSILVASLVLTTLAPQPAHAQTIDLTAASAVAQQLSLLETESNWNALYDQLHPDSQLTVSRQTVAYWYQTYFAPNGPNPAQITGATLTSWTWPVTGRTYPQTAEIAYTQTFANGTTIDEIVRLVPAPDGTWRWFFGRSPEFIQQITQEAGQALDPAPIPDRTGIPAPELFAEAIASITAVAPACFAAAGIRAVPETIGFDSINSNASESGTRTESVTFMPSGPVAAFPISWSTRSCSATVTPRRPSPARSMPAASPGKDRRVPLRRADSWPISPPAPTTSSPTTRNMSKPPAICPC